MKSKKFIQTNWDLAFIWGSYHNELVDLRNLILSKNQPSFWNRSFVRSLMSMVEGINYRVRQALITKHETGEIKLTSEELITLKEIKVDIDNNGDIKMSPLFFSFSKLFKFTYKTYTKYHSKEGIYSKEISSHYFRTLCEVSKIRNRVTHPKEKYDVVVYNHEVEKAFEAFDWFHKFAIKIFDGDLIQFSETFEEIKS